MKKNSSDKRFVARWWVAFAVAKPGQLLLGGSKQWVSANYGSQCEAQEVMQGFTDGQAEAIGEQGVVPVMTRRQAQAICNELNAVIHGRNLYYGAPGGGNRRAIDARVLLNPVRVVVRDLYSNDNVQVFGCKLSDGNGSEVTL